VGATCVEETRLAQRIVGAGLVKIVVLVAEFARRLCGRVGRAHVRDMCTVGSDVGWREVVSRPRPATVGHCMQSAGGNSFL